MTDKTEKPDANDELWEAVAASVKPLKGRKKTVFTEKKFRISAEKKLTVSVTPLFREPDVDMRTFETLSAGDVHFMDKNTAERFKTGKMKIDAVLDLHGYVLDKAFEILKNFIYTQSRKAARCVLVITGKGLDGNSPIRLELPAWLNHIEIRSLIVSFTQACPKDGGKGAFYILLKRKRPK